MIISNKEERDARKEIVFIGKLLYQNNLVSATDGNISVRIKDTIITTPSGVCKGFMKEKDLILLNLNGGIIKNKTKKKPTSELKMHIAAYKARADIRALVHAHPKQCIALSLVSSGLHECIIPELAVSLGSIPTIPYIAPSTAEFAKSIENMINKTDALMLSKHGSLTVGKTLREAYFKLEQMEHAASIIHSANMIGKVDRLTEEEVKHLMELRKTTYKMTNPVIPFY